MVHGCSLPSARVAKERHCVRNHESTSYISSFGSVDEFGAMLREEALRRGMANAGWPSACPRTKSEA